MNKDIITQFIHSIDDSIDVEFSDVFESDLHDRIIYIGTLPNNFTTNLQMYLYIDSGYKWYNYCKPTTWCILHELGHIMSSDTYDDIDDELVKYQYNRLLNKYSDKCDYDIIKDYMNLQLEKDANNWAYKYLLNNKDIIKRLEEEITLKKY